MDLVPIGSCVRQILIAKSSLRWRLCALDLTRRLTRNGMEWSIHHIEVGTRRSDVSLIFTTSWRLDTCLCNPFELLSCRLVFIVGQQRTSSFVASTDSINATTTVKTSKLTKVEVRGLPALVLASLVGTLGLCCERTCIMFKEVFCQHIAGT